MKHQEERVQWRLGILIYHGSAFGHRISLETQRQGYDTVERTIGSWKGLGIPESVLTQASAVLTAAFEEHLVSRYGVAGELPLRWAGEPDPF